MPDLIAGSLNGQKGQKSLLAIRRSFCDNAKRREENAERRDKQKPKGKPRTYNETYWYSIHCQNNPLFPGHSNCFTLILIFVFYCTNCLRGSAIFNCRSWGFLSCSATNGVGDKCHGVGVTTGPKLHRPR